MFIVKFLGGIGNQLYQYNFINYLKNKYPKAKIVVDYSYYNFDAIHGGFMLDGIKVEETKKYISSLFRYMDDSTYIEDFKESDNIIFEGYWQNTRFLEKSYFSFNDIFTSNINTESQNFYNEIMETDNSVSIHVRCGDYDNHPYFGNISTKAYYNNAITKICNKIENPVFYIFSNNINWAQEHLNFHNKKAIYITCNSKPEDAKWDLYLMSSCKHNIISNSSFSWWAQRFNTNDKKIVITPPYWVNEKSACFTQNSPDIQNFEYMQSVSNLPSKVLETSKNLSILISVGNDIQEFYKLHRIISTILNHFEKIPNLIIYSYYQSDEISTYVKSISETCNISLYYNSDKNLFDLMEIINTKFIFFTNANYYFYSNSYSIIDKAISDYNTASLITFNESGDDTILIGSKERKFNSIYDSKLFFSDTDISENINIINEKIIAFKAKSVEIEQKKLFLSKIKKAIIFILKIIINNF